MLLPLKFYFLRQLARNVMLSIVLSVAVCMTVTMYFSLVASIHRINSSNSELLRTHTTTIRPRPVAIESSRKPLLQRFESAKFIAHFNENISSVGLQAEEVSYSLETQPAQPYQRYRIRIPVKADYPMIRRFLAALNADMPHVTLDSIHCERENTATVLLTCTLSFSAFFQLEGTRHG